MLQPGQLSFPSSASQIMPPRRMADPTVTASRRLAECSRSRASERLTDSSKRMPLRALRDCRTAS